MKKQFQSKSVPRGTRTIWRYLGALFLLFTFGIGQMWGALTTKSDFSDGDIFILSQSNVDAATWIEKGSSLTSTGTQTPQWKPVAGSASADVAGTSETFYKMKKVSDNRQLTLKVSGVSKITFYTHATSTNRTLRAAVDGASATNLVTASTSNKTYKGDLELTANATHTIVIDLSNEGYVTALKVTVPSLSGDVDPVFTYTPATYTIGSTDPLDLSTKLTSTNTAGAITFAISTADDGSTGASIASNKNFTATTAGTAKVTVTQAASTGYNEKSQDINVTVVEPDTKCFNMPLITSKPDDMASVSVTGGTLTDANKASKAIEFDAKGLKFGGSAARLKVTLSSATIVENTKITVTYDCTSDKGSGIAIYNGEYAHKTMNQSCSGKESGSWEHTFTAAEAANYADEFMIDRNSGGGTMIVRAITVEDCGPEVEKHTITLNYNDGVTPSGSLLVVDGKTATQPADPERGKYTFLGWNKGSSEYNWSSAVTEDFTLVAQWQDPWTITFDEDGGSSVADITVKHNTKATKPTDPTKENYEFDGWYYGNPETAFDWNANVTANYALKAHWLAVVAKYDIEYYDGETKIGTEAQVRVDQHPTAAGIETSKSLYHFDGWFLSSALTGDPVNLNTVTPSEGLKIYGKWTKTYGSSLDFAAVTTAGTTASNPIATFLASGNMAATGLTESLWETSTGKSGFIGYKLKDAGAQIKFNLQAGKRAIITLGNVAAAVNINAGGAESVVAAAAGDDAETVVPAILASTEDILVTLTTTTKGTVTLKSILIEDIPALDNDHTLKDLKVGGVTVAGFSAGTGTYYYEVPYGTEDFPVISATANSIKALQVAIQQAVWADAPYNCYRAQANVQAQDGSWGYYDVRFYFAPKYGVELIKATHDGTAAGADKAGYWASDVTVDKFTQNGGKLGSADHYFGLTLGNEKTFKAGDLVVIKASNISSTVELFDTKTFASKEDSLSYLNKGNFDTNSKMYTFTLTADADKLYLYRTKTANSQMNPTVDYIAVYRLMAPFIEEFKIGEAVGTITGTNIAVEVPYAADLEHLTPAVKYWANGTAQISPAVAEKDFSSAVEYTVSSSYAEDATGAYAPVTYTVTVTKEPHYVAKIGTTGYTSLAAALEHAADGEIVLLEDIDVTAQIEIAAGVTATIDLAGYKIEYTGTETLPSGVILVHNGASLTINDSSDPDAGSIVSGDKAYAAVALTKLGDDASNPATLVVNGGALTGYYYGITGNGSRNNTVITINGGTITGTVGIAIYHPQVGTLTVNNGSLTGEDAAIEMRAGTLVINDGTFTATATEFSCNPNGSGSTTSGAAIAIAQHTTKKDISVTINGGTFNGVKALNESNPQVNDPAPQVTMAVTAGTFTGEVTTVDVNNFISGGTFDHEVAANQCAEGYAPTSWTVGTETKYGVHLLGVIRGAASTNSDGVYYYTLDNDVTIFSSESDGRLKASNHIATSNDIEPCGGDKGGYNVNQSKFVLKFPVNVKEFTLYGANSTERTISKVYVNAEASKDIKISNVGRELTGTYSNTKDGKCQTLTAVYAGENVIAANDYVLVTLSGTANIYRILYTEAECTDPVINSTDATRMKVGETATVSVDASAVGATYQWYRCEDALDANPQIITNATAASYSFTKVAGDEYFKVVVGNNCNDVKVEAIVKAEEWFEVTRTNVTGYTEWNWNDVADTDDGIQIAEAQKGLVLASYLNAPNFDKLEGINNAYVYRNNSYPAYQGSSLKFTTEVAGLLTMTVRSSGSGQRLFVNGVEITSEDLTSTPTPYNVVVKAGDVTITSGGNIRIYAMTFDPNLSPEDADASTLGGYERDVTEGRYGTICLPNGGVMTGATLYEVAYYGETSKKIFFDEVLNGTMVAGVPYIYLPNENATKLGVFYTDKANATPATEGVNGLIGYIGASEETSDALEVPVGSYILNNNQYREVVYAGSAKILSHRAYINLSAINPSEPALVPGRRRISMGVQSEQVVTGIDALNVGEQPIKVMINGQIFILRGEKMYDATGRLVK